MEGFLRVDTSLVMSVVGVMFWDKLVRGIEGERLLPVSKQETLVAKSGQDGRNDTNRARPRGLDLGPTTEAKLIVFMLGNSGGMQDVCWFVSTFSLKRFFLQVVESISCDSVEEVFKDLTLHNIPSQRPKVHCVPTSKIRRCALLGLHQFFKDQFNKIYEIHVFSLTYSDHH